MVLLDDSLVGFERNTPYFEQLFAPTTYTKHGGLRGPELRPYAFFLFTSVLCFTSVSLFYFAWFPFCLRGFLFCLRGSFFACSVSLVGHRTYENGNQYYLIA